MEFLVVLLLAVAGITVVGHGLWLLCARLVGALPDGGEARPRAGKAEPCAGCGWRLMSGERACLRCGLRPDSPTASELRDLDAAARGARRLAAQGELDEETAARLLQAVAQRRDALRRPHRTARPVAHVRPLQAAPVEEDVPLLEMVPEAPAPAAAVMAAAPAPPPAPVPPPAPPRPPKRSWGDVLAGFMEERNILWGELVGGLLIVGCSTALVITLWQTLEQIPYFPFLVLSGISLALFGAGHYTLHHWKLESTSRGLLVIATLLVPLNLLVLAGLSRGREGGVLEAATVAAGLAVFALAVGSAGRVLAGEARWLLALGVVGTAAPQLLAPRLSGPLGGLFVLPAWLTVACHCLALGVRLRRVREEDTLAPRDCHALLLFLGAVTFAAAVALGFLVARAADLRPALQQLALPLAAAGVPILGAGLLMQRRLSASPPSEEDARALGGLRATATAVALAGALVLLGPLALAWPSPAVLLMVCLVDSIALTGLAFHFRTPFLHAAALPCLVLGLLASLHLPSASLTPAALFSPAGGALLARLVVLLAAAAEALVRKGLREPATVYAAGSAATGVLSLVLVSLGGGEHAGRAALVSGLYAATALLANLRWQRIVLDYAGRLLLLFATLWALRWGGPDISAVWGMVLALEALALAALAAGSPGRAGPNHNVACVAALLACVLALAAADFPAAPGHAATALLLAATALVLAWVNGVAALTWVAAALLWAGMAHLFVGELPAGTLPRPWVASLLACSSLLMSGRVALGWLIPAAAVRVHALYTGPLGRAALAGSLLALPVFLGAAWGETAVLAGYAAWVALLWLAFAWFERSPGWLTAFQAALSAAVLLAVAAAVEEQPWGSRPIDLADLRTLYALGLGLGLLGLVWVLLRLGLRDTEPARVLLAPPWPAWDRLVLGGLVLAQLALAARGVWPGVVSEFVLDGLPALPPSGPGAWLLLGVLGLVLAASLWDRAVPAACGLLLLALTVPLLAAPGTVRPATALCWGLGLALPLCSTPLWLRVPLCRLAERWGIDTRCGPSTNQLLRLLLVAFTAGPVVVWTALVLLVRLAGESRPTLGIVEGAGPLVLVGLALLGYALRERAPGHAFTAGWGVNLAASLLICRTPNSDMAGVWVSFFQVNIVACSALAFLWLGADACSRVWQAWPPRKHVLLGVQALLGLCAASLLLLGPLLLLVARPGYPRAQLTVIGQPLGWLAGALAALAALWFGARRVPRRLADLLGVCGLCLGVLAACTAQRWQPLPWLAYHVLTACWAVLGLAVAAGLQPADSALKPEAPARGLEARSASEGTSTEARIANEEVPSLALRASRPNRQVANLPPRGLWVLGLALALVVLGLRAGWSDPLRPYASAGPVLLAAIMAGILALRWRRPEHVYLSGVLLTLAGVLGWVAWGPGTPASFTLTVSLSLAGAAAVWALIDLRTATPFPMPFHHAAAGAALVLLGLVVLAGIDAVLVGASFRAAGVLTWAAVFMVAVALAVTLWDGRARLAPAGLFAVGLLAVAVGLQELPLAAGEFARLAAPALAAYVLLAAAVVAAVPRLAGLMRVLRLPSRLGEPPRDWFRLAEAGLAGLALLLSVWVDLSFATPAGRLAGPAAVALLLPAALLLTARAPGWWVAGMRFAVLALGALLGVEAGWALLTPGAAGWLHHSVVCLAVLVVLAVAYGDGLRRLPAGHVWRACGGRMAAVLAGLAALTLLVLLGQEFKLYDRAARHTPLTGAEVALGVLAVLALVYLALRAALAAAPGQPTGRQTLPVYGAELLLVLLFVHLKLNVPALFGKWGAKYWTLFVMALGYAGAGLGEFFQRRGVAVLAGPLRRTGLFLPLLPLLAFWMRPPLALLSAAEASAPGTAPLLAYLSRLPWAFERYALLWFLLSLLYALVALSRRSLWLALLAALAANFGLWSLLAHFEVAFLLHPQVWLIPLALIVLIAEYLNRDRLTREQRLLLRYLGLSMVYVSSTADLFIAGLGNSAALPVVLAVLSVLGVLTGILLRVRAFLFMGLTFLALDVFAMIWHAAVDRTQTWVWYVSGIVLGSAILALFAVFEKRRNDVLRLLDDLRRWN